LLRSSIVAFTVSTFVDYGAAIDSTADADLPDTKSVPVALPILVEEAKNACTLGMLLCLDRKQRLILTLGEIQRAQSSPCNEGLSSCDASIELLVSGANFEHVAHAQSRVF
jgi:hypothetical protein